MKLINNHPQLRHITTTLEELKAEHAKKKSFTVGVFNYRSGPQVEVRRVVEGYHGKQFKIMATYEIVGE